MPSWSGSCDMGNQKRRVEKLELKNRRCPEQIWIPYVFHETDGAAGEARAKAAALADWERDNGPPGDRSLNFIARCIIASKSRGNYH